MSANVATNFPPQTYSSQFFLNQLTDEGGTVSSTSKKRSKTSPDGAESSNAVLDCFISTMHSKISKHLLIIMVLLQITLTTAQKKYTCADGSHTQIRKFETISEFQRNSVKFDPENNYVSFEMLTIGQLLKNDFIGYDSNHVRKMILSNKRIEMIDAGTFNELYCVKYLLLQDNLISEIKNGTFEGLPSLQELYLNNNNIKEISNGCFWNLKHLLKLDLSFNKIKYMYFNSFQYVTSLWELNLEFNIISDLPNGLFTTCTHLHKLYLGNNKITVPSAAEFTGLNTLDVLDLQNNQIRFIGQKAFSNLELSELNLYGNQIIELNITELPKSLERINIAHNNFQCTYLKDLLLQLETNKIGIIINENTEFNNVDSRKVGCINGTVPNTPLPTTTSEKPWFTKPSRGTTKDTIIFPTIPTEATTVGKPDDDQIWKIEKENRGILKAVSDLKTVVVILIIIIVMFHLIDILIRTNSFQRFRVRFQRRHQPVMQFHSGYSESAFPLLSR